MSNFTEQGKGYLLKAGRGDHDIPEREPGVFVCVDKSMAMRIPNGFCVCLF